MSAQTAPAKPDDASPSASSIRGDVDSAADTLRDDSVPNGGARSAHAGGTGNTASDRLADASSDNGAQPDGETARILGDLSRRTEQDPATWRENIFDATSRWHLPLEKVSGDDEYVYFIAGEAFNWRRLAERLAWHIELLLPDELVVELRQWVEDDHIFGGIEESDFRRILGSDKWRAYLNYFYGVTLERCLLVYAGNRIGKQEFSRGRHVTDDALDDAFVALYDASEQELWAQFVAENNAADAEDDVDTSHPDEARSTAQDDEFTYWLFKRRIASTYQVHIAHEVKHGLELFDNVGNADERRRKMLAQDDISALLEFKLAKRSVRRSRSAPASSSKPATKGA